MGEPLTDDQLRILKLLNLPAPLVATHPYIAKLQGLLRETLNIIGPLPLTKDTLPLKNLYYLIMQELDK